MIPATARFCFPWREYQAAVLSELEEHLDDRHLNIVSAPGSGKTILGLEVMRRIGRPTLVLAPTVAIKQQWVTRWQEHFLCGETGQGWISTDITQPRYMTVATYQGVHQQLRGWTGGEGEPLPKLIQQLQVLGTHTLVVDEAHHLRSEWWRSLTNLKRALDEPQVVALTATPPYDVAAGEWQKYQALCGEIDAEITVPELVATGDLCPHDDLLCLGVVTPEEAQQVDEARVAIAQVMVELKQDTMLAEALAAHPCLTDPMAHTATVLAAPEGYVSLAVYLQWVGVAVPQSFLSLVGGGRAPLPAFNHSWAEKMLTQVLYGDAYLAKQVPALCKRLRQRLSRAGVLHRRQVHLRQHPAVTRVTQHSVSKLGLVVQIAHYEQKQLGEKLRQVILTDYVRADEHSAAEAYAPQRMGVVPIFEVLRREKALHARLGVLCGAMVLVPCAAKTTLRQVARNRGVRDEQLHIAPCEWDEWYLTVKLKGKAQAQTVRVVTELFERGEVTTLVGTQALLGEGWDAPTVNSLVLATEVGSFMLSNQMRGRAIRVDENAPDKVAFIWHLGAVVTGSAMPEYDIERLERRWRAFVGLNRRTGMIESGWGRVWPVSPPYTRATIAAINAVSWQAAADRPATAKAWQTALAAGKVRKIVPQLQTPQRALPRWFVWRDTLWALVWRSGLLGGATLMQVLRGVRWQSVETLSELWLWLGVGLGLGVVVSLPGLGKALWLTVRNGPVRGHMRQICQAVLGALVEVGEINTPAEQLHIVVQKGEEGVVSCQLMGATTYETAKFLTAVAEVVQPIENPRYLISRESGWRGWRRSDFHAVPTVLGRKKHNAQVYAAQWRRHVGRGKLVYTRTAAGRGHLLRARVQALSGGLLGKTQRRSVWA